jgi:hypothetical protein
MSDKDEGVEMEVRNRHAITSEVSNVTDDSIATVESGENVSMSASVRRLLSDENFNAPKQEGTVRHEFQSTFCCSRLNLIPGVEFETVVLACRCWKCGWTR